MKTIVYTLLFSLFFSCQNSEQMTQETNVTSQKTEDLMQIEVKSRYKAETIFDLEHGWGYQIFEGEQLKINQPNVPAVQGLHGFKSKDDALKTANLMIHKMEVGIFPPSITLNELDSLNIQID